MLIDGSPAHPSISQYVLKVHSRCDLACDHCYVYEHADQSWRDRPRFMTSATVRAAAGRIADHAASHRLRRVLVVLHGGEPLLLGVARMRATLEILRARIEPVTRLDLRMQTNGVLLSPAMCDLLVEFDVRVGVSLDGDREANDRHRRFANGASSFDQVLSALALLRRREYRQLYAGLLCTVDVRNNPSQVYAALAAQDPPRIDFLLPHATWDQPPLRPGPDPTPYATWLLRIHELWLSQGRPMTVRLFESLRSIAEGGPSESEWVGLDPVDLVVIETDGAWEQVDSLKTAYDGAPATGFDVFTHPVDTVANWPGVARRQSGIDDLCDSCRNCPVVRQCGGGLFAHRYRTGSGFNNPSAYCADLKELITAMEAHRPARTEPTDSPSVADLPPDLVDQIGSGRADEASLRYLAAKQVAFTRALVTAVASRSADTTADAWDLLSRLDHEAPEAVHAVLSHPYLRVWAVDCLSRQPAVADSAYLACIAAAAALHSGTTAQVSVPVRDAQVHLPTWGTVVMPPSIGGTASLVVSPSELIVQSDVDSYRLDPHRGWDDDESIPRWQPTRWIRADELTIVLEDMDPYRDCHDWKADGRLTRSAAQAWAASIAGAWRVVHEEVPEQLPVLQIGLRAVVPLADDPSGMMRSSTPRHAFGSVGAARASDDALAVMLVHEMQHSVLGALLDLCELFDRSYLPRLRVGWRTDLRPIEGVLQGTFAHLAVADVWRGRAERSGPDSDAAGNFRLYRDWTAAAIDTLSESDALTPAGSRFVDRMAQTLASWSR